MQRKKAVIVGIAKYPRPFPKLTASLNEVGHWRDLLVKKYDFAPEDVRMVCEERATKRAIMDRLEWLLFDANGGDQLVFAYAGHGVRLRRRNPDGTVHDNMDEAILAYPESGQLVEDHAIYDDDLARITILADLPAWTDFTIVLDCCFGGGFNLNEPDQRPVYVPPRDVRNREDAGGEGTRRVGDCRTFPRETQNPVILAATPKIATSPTIDDSKTGERRTLFGYHATTTLFSRPTLSYLEVQAVIEKQMRAYNIPNAPVLTGNSARFDHPFLS